jgi:ribonuclease H2 subunit B
MSNFGHGDGATEASASQFRNDLIQFCSLECTRKALPKLCDIKSDLVFHSSRPLFEQFSVEVSSDIVVYQYSSSKTMEYLRAKVKHLETNSALDTSRTITRNLAKDCLMDDGQENLLKRES